jgi:hypothetical protein
VNGGNYAHFLACLFDESLEGYSTKKPGQAISRRELFGNGLVERKPMFQTTEVTAAADVRSHRSVTLDVVTIA